MNFKKYDVHLHAVVRVKIVGVAAPNECMAAQRAQQIVDLNALFSKNKIRHRYVAHTEYDDTVTHLLVEPAGNDKAKVPATSKCFEPFDTGALMEVPVDRVSTHIAVIVEDGNVQSLVTNRPCQVAVLNHDHAQRPGYDVEEETEFHDSEIEPWLRSHYEFRTRYAKEKST
jgi:hypothetical protein